MGDESDIRPVYSHAERIGGNDRLQLSCHEPVLGHLAAPGVESPVVRQDLEAFLLQEVRHFLYVLYRGRIDDPIALGRFEQPQQLPLLFTVSRNSGALKRSGVVKTKSLSSSSI